ncbi:hypothetical protein CGGC5_v003818 [Colletotrichum fructicola Nara gc5]|uniref:Uncharacterized protein n=1 Tax=Colletotrichum fructicola (strain Nara gc5) TaxID=1213859 RepID=A0A7J6JH31_COLFN|nr:hypothetical protein CGGC5_v003818 [Colletotrichum fructicola Nara gc5]
MIMPASADALNRLRHAVTLQHSSTAAGRTQHKWHQLPKLLTAISIISVTVQSGYDPILFVHNLKVGRASTYYQTVGY